VRTPQAGSIATAEVSLRQAFAVLHLHIVQADVASKQKSLSATETTSAANLIIQTLRSVRQTHLVRAEFVLLKTRAEVGVVLVLTNATRQVNY